MPFFSFFAGLVGLAFGSFVNALEWRLHKDISMNARRSVCPKCGQTLRWFHLFPVMSFLALRGRCAFCHETISWQYPIVELWLGAAFLFLSFVFQTPTALFFWYSAIVFVLTLIFIYDAKYQEIPDVITLPAIVLFLFCGYFLRLLVWPQTLLSVVIGGGLFLIQYLVSRGKWVGGGDIRLGVLMGIILGFPNIILALFVAYVVGAVWASALLLRKKKHMNSEIAFGTFLTVATLFTMAFGSDIVGAYTRIVGW